MLMTPEPSTDETHTLRRTLKRYALRYHITGSDQDALVEQTVTALAADPDAVLDKPVEQAIAEVMHRIFLANAGHMQERLPRSGRIGPQKSSVA